MADGSIRISRRTIRAICTALYKADKRLVSDREKLAVFNCALELERSLGNKDILPATAALINTNGKDYGGL